MDFSNQNSTTRRKFFETAGKLAAVSALANVAIPAVRAAGSDQIQIALIGCGGRGGGAAANALSVKRVPTKLVAMADIFPARRRASSPPGPEPARGRGCSAQFPQAPRSDHGHREPAHRGV